MSKTDAGELLAGRGAVQVFRATGNYLEIISPVIATYRRQNAGSITISLHRMLPERSAFLRWLFKARERLAASLRARFQTASNEWLAPRPPLVLSKPLAEMTTPCSELADNEAVDFAAGPLTTSPGELRTGRRPCTVPWNSAAVLGNGDVAACCVPGLVMGNLNENSMEEIWNGPRYRELRATVNSSKPLPPCAACPMFRQTDNPDSYLIHSAMRRLNA